MVVEIMWRKQFGSGIKLGGTMVTGQIKAHGQQGQAFLKWAGGKRWLVASHAEILSLKFRRYVEPFLGSGAVYFHLQPKRAILADVNAELINCYSVIRDQPRAVLKVLAKHQRLHSVSHYYEERSRQRRSPVQRAAQFLYLNRTCWNGLYRVNLRGEFNVPIGTKSSVLLPTDDFELTSKLLRSAKLYTQDFELTLENTGEGDFIFADPPYTVKHNLNGFLKYNESIFSWDDQRRLCSVLSKAKRRGAKILLTNADHESVRELYRGLGNCKVLSRHTVLSGDPAYRGKATELCVLIDGADR
jgi:DNA adenine methylase